MSSTKSEKLTPEQEALIPVTLEKWKAIALSTERIDRQKAIATVTAAYTTIGLSEPKILFFDSPYAALYTLGSNPPSSQLVNQLWKQLWNQLYYRSR